MHASLEVCKGRIMVLRERIGGHSSYRRWETMRVCLLLLLNDLGGLDVLHYDGGHVCGGRGMLRWDVEIGGYDS